MLDNKVIIDLDDYVDDIDVDLSDVVIAHSTPPLLQDKTVSPTTSQQEIMADVGYSGLNKVTINAVTSAIDNNIQPENIKKDVTILGVTGTLVVGNSDEIIEGTATSITTNATKVATYKFSSDVNLTEFIGNSVLRVERSAFQWFKNDFDFSLQNVTYIDEYAFQHNAWYINKVELPNCVTINAYAFANNGQTWNNTISTLLLPKVKTIGSYAFTNWGAIASLTLPELTTIGNGSFRNCSSLISVNLGNLAQIKQQCFQNCSSMTTITIPNTSLCTLQNATNCLPASATQHIDIYVPSNLIDSYKVATNWSTLYNDGRVDFLPIQ